VHGKHHLQRRHGHDEEGHQMDQSMAAHSCGVKSYPYTREMRPLGNVALGCGRMFLDAVVDNTTTVISPACHCCGS
jgi:hypothetical protein